MAALTTILDRFEAVAQAAAERDAAFIGPRISEKQRLDLLKEWEHEQRVKATKLTGVVHRPNLAAILGTGAISNF